MLIYVESKRPRHFHTAVLLYNVETISGYWICNLPTQVPATIIPGITVGIWKIKTLKNNQELK